MEYHEIQSIVTEEMLRVLKVDFPHFLEINLKETITEKEKEKLFSFFAYCLGLKELDMTDGEPDFEMTEIQQEARSQVEAIYENNNIEFLEYPMDLANDNLVEYVEDSYDDSKEARE